MDEFDDEDGPTFPLAAAIAGWVWQVFGTLLIAAGIVLAAFGMLKLPFGIFLFIAGVCLMIPGGYAFRDTGQMTLRGRVSELAYPAAASIGFGLLGLAVLMLVPLAWAGVHLVFGPPLT